MFIAKIRTKKTKKKNLKKLFSTAQKTVLVRILSLEYFLDILDSGYKWKQ